MPRLPSFEEVLHERIGRHCGSVVENSLAAQEKPTEHSARNTAFRRLGAKFSHSGLGPSLGRSGSLELRLATKKSEIRKAQKLRFHVFFEEGGADAGWR